MLNVEIVICVFVSVIMKRKSTPATYYLTRRALTELMSFVKTSIILEYSKWVYRFDRDDKNSDKESINLARLQAFSQQT